ncbi:hypothetical protein AK830_g8074 [Neonectria ditissima]|uniref:Fido domain-containing protein n=1 Tax=Neonectria ditissima TaxID=78410 RepID=A0A0P7AKZ1_9HYPO|nr:hypothetical protein AK830_g8074 [Neonectria ditissima]
MAAAAMFARRTSVGVHCHVVLGQHMVRDFTHVAKARLKLLEDVYKPFKKFPRNSPEWIALAESGRVWEDYHQPADSVKQGYIRLQEEHASSLQEIDTLKDSMKFPASVIAKRLVAAYAHQSVKIEDNRLKSGESIVIEDYLNSHYFKTIDLKNLSSERLKDLALPDVSFLVPNVDRAQVVELRNHLLASHWISETSLRHQGTSGFGENEIRHLSALTMSGLAPGAHYPGIFGPKVKLGEYRQTPIGVQSNPMRVFPYHPEVPACMGRFFQWRKKVHDEKRLHPLIIACQTVACFLHIHPFPDGNGRVSRMVMHDYLLRNGYAPIVFQPLERKDYLRMIKNAQDGEPDEFVARVVTTQLEMMYTFKMEEKSG